MTYSNSSSESGISNIYNDQIPISIILRFFLSFFFFHSQYWPFYWVFVILHGIKLPCPTKISQKSLTFSLGVFRSWSFTSVENFKYFFYLILIGQTTPYNVLFRFVNPNVNKLIVKIYINKNISNLIFW